MAEPTLVQVFGSGAVQDANTVTIQKSALAAVGLTTSADNRAEALLAALVKVAAAYLSRENYDANLDQSIYIDAGLNNLSYRGTTPYSIQPYTINFAKLAPASTIDPDDY
jgi:hypothetical protein